MRSYYIGNHTEIIVFPKTGNTFLGNLMRQNSEDIFSKEIETEELFNSRNSRAVYVSVREPFDRFVSGFVTCYLRSGEPGPHVYKLNHYLRLLAAYEILATNNDITQAFKLCHEFMNGNWSWDAHTKTDYDGIKTWKLQEKNNVVFFPHTQIGKLLENLGYIPDQKRFDQMEHKTTGSTFNNVNPTDKKEIIRDFLLSNSELHKDICDYISMDQEIYQSLKITEI